MQSIDTKKLTIPCAQGRAAWLERGRRCSLTENAASYHRRWVKRNRIHDASLGGSSDDDDFLGVLRGPSSFANAFLYVGLGSIAIGLVIAFVGTGEKGFKTNELRLIGPSLIGIGLICCILRIFFCICPSNCIASSRRKLKKKNAKVDADHTTSLLRREGISTSRETQSKYHQTGARGRNEPSAKMNEGMEALRHLATTSLFLRNEQNPLQNIRTVPAIKEPDKTSDDPLEMKKMYETSLEICSVSDDEGELALNESIEPSTSLQIATTFASLDTNFNPAQSTLHPSTSKQQQQPQTQSQQPRPNKLLRSRAPVNQTQPKPKDIDLMLMETSLSAPISASTSSPSTSKQLPVELSTSSSLLMSTRTKDVKQLQSKTPNNEIKLQSLPSKSSKTHQAPTKKSTGIKETPMTTTTTAAATSSTSKQQQKPPVQDGHTRLTFVQPSERPNASSQMGGSELVLSPAKLGQ